MEKSQYELPGPTRHDHPTLFTSLGISLQPQVRFMCGLLCWVATSLLLQSQVTPTLLDNDCRTWHVQSEGCREKFPWHNSGTARPILLKFGMWPDTHQRRCSQELGGGKCSRAHVLTPFIYLRNGLANWAQILCVVENQSAKGFPLTG